LTIPLPTEIPLSADLNRLVGLIGVLVDPAAIEDVDIDDLDLMNFACPQVLALRVV
jgi:hypothetical protein